MKRFIILLLIFLFTVTGLYSIALEHHQQLEYDCDNDEITVNVTGMPEDNTDVFIVYKSAADRSFKNVEMKQEGALSDTYVVSCSELEVTGQIHYYFELRNQNGAVATLPTTNPDINPFLSSLITDEETSEEFILLSPDDDYKSGDLIIAVSLFNIAERINIESVKVLDNGKNVTSSAEISSNMVVYEIEDPDDIHVVEIVVKDGKGGKIVSPDWSFGSKSVTTDFTYSGDVTLRTKHYSETYESDDEEEDDSDSRTDLTLNFKGKYKRLDIKSRLFLSSLDESDTQAVNRYKIQMMVPHFRLIGGDHTPNHNTLITQGKNIRGVHGKLFFPGFAFYTSLTVSAGPRTRRHQ